MEISNDFSKASRFSDIGRFYVTNFVTHVAAALAPGTSILDAGAGECAYKKYFSHCIYKSVDLAVGDCNWHYEHLDYVSPLHELPIADGSFDAVLCTQVLEHLNKPLESVKEIYRILKPGGKLYLTAPMAHCEHQTPHDFFRYTSFGLKYLCEEAGFKTVDIAPFGGLLVRWAYELPRGLELFPPARLNNWKGLLLAPFKKIMFAVIRITQMVFLALDRFDYEKNDPFGWRLIAVK
ncbi:MAG: class I SAM-dependent methyltransferase [Thermodesulfovibrionales bacterium]|jgi:SAM-dependent methyltransferase